MSIFDSLQLNLKIQRRVRCQSNMSTFKSGALFLLALNILISNSEELRVSSMFSIRDELNDIMFQHALLFQTSAHTLSECSLLCVNLVSCTSFQIHPQQMLCRLYWTHFLLDLIGISSTGWRTYSDNGKHSNKSISPKTKFRMKPQKNRSPFLYTSNYSYRLRKSI